MNRAMLTSGREAMRARGTGWMKSRALQLALGVSALVALYLFVALVRTRWAWCALGGGLALALLGEIVLWRRLRERRAAQ